MEPNRSIDSITDVADLARRVLAESYPRTRSDARYCGHSLTRREAVAAAHRYLTAQKRDAA